MICILLMPYNECMKHIPSASGSLVILERGEELHRQLRQFAVQNNLRSGWVAGLGGAARVTLGFYDIETKEYLWQEFVESLEIVSLSGNLAIIDNEPFWHIHGVFSGHDYQAIGGHVKELIVGLTGELHITPLEVPITRKYDEATGLKLMCPIK